MARLDPDTRQQVQDGVHDATTERTIGCLERIMRSYRRNYTEPPSSQVGDLEGRTVIFNFIEKAASKILDTKH